MPASSERRWWQPKAASVNSDDAANPLGASSSGPQETSPGRMAKMLSSLRRSGNRTKAAAPSTPTDVVYVSPKQASGDRILSASDLHGGTTRQPQPGATSPHSEIEPYSATVVARPTPGAWGSAAVVEPPTIRAAGDVLATASATGSAGMITPDRPPTG